MIMIVREESVKHYEAREGDCRLYLKLTRDTLGELRGGLDGAFRIARNEKVDDLVSTIEKLMGTIIKDLKESS